MNDNFLFSTKVKVRVSDLNYGGHVHHAQFFNYFHEVRIDYLKNLGFSEFDLGDGNGLIMVEEKANFKAEVFLGEELWVWTRISSIKRASFKMDYKITKENDPHSKPLSLGSSTFMIFDYNKRKPATVPKIFKEKVLSFEKNLAKEEA